MIDTSVPYSPGWWMMQLANRLNNPKRLRRLKLLYDYWEGNPPLPVGAENSLSAYRAFQKKARSNFAALIVEAPQSMLKARTIRTSVANDDAGDKLAWSYYRRNKLPVRIMDVWRWMLIFGEAYMSVGMPDDSQTWGAAGESPVPCIAPEDPRQMITLDDPNTGRARAALKLFSDDLTGIDYCYLWLPGQLFVATRQHAAPMLGNRPRPTFDAGSFTLAPDLCAEWDVPIVPVVKFHNRGGKGQFEGVLDILDRINHMLLQRLVIATFQAFKQRAISIDPKDMPANDPVTGDEIDYDDIFAADPGALWRLPVGAKVQELGQADLTQMLSGVKDDVMHLAAITRTPLPMLMPDSANQTAEGAQVQREGQTFTVEDLQVVCTAGLAEVFSMAFTFAGEPERAQLDEISVDWRPAERYSLAEKSASAVQSAQAGMPWRTRMSYIYQMDPAEIERMEAERQDDALFAAANGIPDPALPPVPPAAETANQLAKRTDLADQR